MTILATDIPQKKAQQDGMSLAQFLTESQIQPFELKHGKKIIKVATVAGHSEVIRLLNRPLDAYCLTTKFGSVFTETAFILPDALNRNWVKGSRIPDLMFISAQRLHDYKNANPDWRTRPYALVPDWVIEVVSPNDTVGELDDKIDTYLNDGVKLIWAIYLQTRKAIVYMPDQEQPRHIPAQGILDADEIAPNFRISLADLFVDDDTV